MMENDLIGLVVRLNLALVAGIVVVLLLRLPARIWFGARVAYALWLLPVLAAGACLLPPRVERLTIADQLAPASPSFASLAGAGPAAVAQLQPSVWLAIWCAGCLLSVAILALRQDRFARALGRLRPRSDLGVGVFGAESCVHGPAVMGVLRPIIVTPADFDQRFSDEERRIVLAHERAHLAQGDPLINAFVVALQCANWFNPLVHLGARALRLDQELAADAAVLATSARRTYAEAILKTQIMAAAPLGAAWPPNSARSLKERIAMLKRTLPSRTQRLLGVSAIAVVALGVCAAAWAAQPARVIVAKSPHIARADAAPFIEPPISDASLLPGDPQADDTNVAAADYSKVDANDDNSADEATDDSEDAGTDNESEADDVISDEDRQSLVDTRARLSPQERAQLRAQVRAAVAQGRAAMAQARDAARVANSEAVRTAIAQSRVAVAQARIAARTAEVESVRAAVATAREVNSPAMQAEIRAMATAAAQMAHDTRMSGEQREEMRAEIRSHADRLRELSHNSCPRQHSAHQSHSDDTQND